MSVAELKVCPTCWDSQLVGCPTCAGTGEWQLHVAPNPNTVAEFADVIFHASSAAAHGVWPDRGGPAHQSSWFVEAVRWYTRMKAFADEQRRLEAERERKRRGARS